MLSTARERDFSRKRIEEPGTGWGVCQLGGLGFGRSEGLEGSVLVVGIILLEYADDDFVWDVQEWVFLDRFNFPDEQPPWPSSVLLQSSCSKGTNQPTI